MNTTYSTNRKFKRMLANILSIAVILAMAFPVMGTVAAQEPIPFLVAFPEWESVEGYAYPLGVNVHLEIDDPSTADITPDYSADGTVVETGWGGNYVKFNFWGEDGYDLKTGDLVSLIYNGERLTHTVRNLSVTNVDVETDSVAGVADPGEEVFANTYDDWGAVVITTTLSSGEWIVNSGLNLEYNSGGRAQIYDDLGNSTAVDWSTPPPPPSPFIWADPICNCINGWDWGDGDSITLEIFDQDSNPFALQTPSQTYSASDGVFFDLNAEGIDLQPGYKVVMSNGTTTKELIVSKLVVKEMNLVANTISGVFDPNLPLFIHAEDQAPLNYEFNGDRWVATFNQSFSIDRFGEAYQPDEDGDKTGMGWEGVPTFMRYDIYAFDSLSKNIQRITKLDGTGEYNPSWSTNGKKIAHDVVYWDGSQSIYITDVKTGMSTLLVEGGNDAAWSPNSKWIAFDDRADIYIVPATGGAATLVKENAVSADWAPSGKRLVFQDTTDGKIKTIAVNGDESTITEVAPFGMNPSWSPDGNWIAYEDGNGDIWKVQVNAQGKTLDNPLQVTSGPFWDGQPTWSADSMTIVYHSGFNTDWDLWSVPATGGTPTWLNGAPEVGDYDPAYAKNSSLVAYASPSPDGQAPRTWVAAYTYNAGTWDAGTHTYQFWAEGAPQGNELSFVVSGDAPPYDGLALIRPGNVLRAQTPEGCASVDAINPAQETQFHAGWTFDGLYADAQAYFANLMAQVRWDFWEPVDMQGHLIFPLTSSVDGFGYTCTFINP